ncbi:aryl-sulfate sulfotransferase [Saccharopolyspora erythraea]|nr:aryl-sulfate sulfotransferase [Saccharopolyspora erythraea]
MVAGPVVVLAALALLFASATAGSAQFMDEGEGSGAPPQPSHFVTRPDLTPPVVNVETPADGTAPGYVFLAPYGKGAQGGPLIVDDTGQPVWSQPVGDGVGQFGMDFKAQQYQGKPVLTWWQGRPHPGFGSGEYVITNQSYKQIATIRMGNNLQADLHELVITPRDTALVMAYNTVQLDRPVVEGVIQEIDIASGRVLFEWHSLDHVGLDESNVPAPEGKPYDYVHLNSIQETAEGDLLVSARHTSALYLVDRETGAVQWRLGGKRSDFQVAPDAAFAWQHDARRQPDGTLTLFDNASDRPGPASRALVLGVDQQARKVSLVKAFPHPKGTTSVSQSSHQVLPGGNHFVGWGSQANFTEFDAEGNVVMHGEFGDGMPSYRAFRLPWVGAPSEPPVAALQPGADGAPTVYASWNGATEVRGWRVLAGPAADQLRPVADVARSGFETAAALPAPEAFAAVEALDAGGNVIGRSAPVQAPAAVPAFAG